MVELIDCNQAIIECCDAVFLDCEAERGVRADQDLVFTFQEATNGPHFALVDFDLIIARCIAQVPLRLNLPVRPESVLGQFFVGEAAPD
ncbi:MAG: hypothetical protein PSV05_13385 [Thermomonas sp.]|nr:hypothetical protein [Thermomonas sp.]MDI1254130.1 hypothetical protein [Thermomonas sp.]